MKKCLLTLSVLLIFYRSQAQEPPCEIIITLKNADTLRYDYRFYTLIDHGMLPLDSLTNHNSKTYYKPNETAVMKTDGDRLLLVAYQFRHCYPQSGDELRVIVLRKKKKDKDFDAMYAACPLRIGTVFIEIDDFREGQRRFEYYRPDADWLNNPSSKWRLNNAFNSPRIYVH